MAPTDETHDAACLSWVASANDHPDFPLQNLPLGVFSTPGSAPRGGVAIGDMVLDLAALAKSGLVTGEAASAVASAARAPLNGFLALGAAPRRALRRALSDLLREDGPQRREAQAMASRLLVPLADATLHLPIEIGDYTDFYAGIRHAENVGKLFRPDNPLLPNYKHVPIGYHGRASSVCVSGGVVRRPHGQIKGPTDESPRFAPSARLDYEMELGIVVGPGNALGEPVPIGEAADHIAAYCVLNDWSARDIQAWEYQPLGPFLAKNFLTTLSPWLVTPEALAPFRGAPETRPAGDPPPLPYLDDPIDRAEGALDLAVEVLIASAAMREQGMAPHRLSLGSARDLYWTPAQMLAHHTSGGCNLRPGDLLGTGTISGATPGSFGSLLELTGGGKMPLTLPTGETRTFLADGDEIVMRAYAERPGFRRIGLGEARAVVAPAM